MVRNDYMLDQDDDIKIIEFNTIAAAIGGLSDRVKLLQEYVIDRYKLTHLDPSKIAKEKQVSKNIGNALALAFKAYGNPDAFIALINDESYQVLSDIRIIVDYVREDLGLDIQTITMDEVAKEAVQQDDGTLLFR